MRASMSDDVAGTFVYSTDGSAEIWTSGRYDTIDDALDEAFAWDAEKVVYIGECKRPPQPESIWEADDWLETVSCQDEYSIEVAEGWDRATKEQKEELETAVRNVMAEWLDKHDLRPKFYLVDEVGAFTREEWESRKASKKPE
ncbi:MAG: hypothetical protein EBX40_06610 [Gammaproteobacteria bacterium]|nr:hypothetical protein [Gammaproteobacteria bacterium]